MRSEYLNFDAIAYEKILAMSMVETVRFPDDVRKKLQVLSKEVVDDLGRQSADLKRVYDSYMSF